MLPLMSMAIPKTNLSWLTKHFPFGKGVVMNAVKWVLIDNTKGAATQDGSVLSAKVLSHIAEAVQDQVNREFAVEWGADTTLRVGTNVNDIKPGEWAYV